MAIISQFNPSQPPALSVSETGASTANEVYSLTAPSLATEALTMTSPDGTTFSWKPTELVYRDTSGQMDYIVGSSPSTLATRGKEARYHRTFPSADDVFIAENQQVKHWTVLHEPPRLPADYLTTGIEFGVSGIVNGVPLPTGSHESIQAEPFNLPQPFVKDLAGNEIYGRYEVVDTTEGQQLFIWFDASFLESALYPVMIDPTVVVNTGYSTAGNGGRKLVTLSNGWLVAAALGNSQAYFYKSEDEGVTWSPIGWTNYSVEHFAIASKGTELYCVQTYSASSVALFFRFDVITATNTEKALTSNIDTGQSSFGSGISIAVNSAGTELWTAWSSKNSMYPNSFNIRVTKGTIAQNGSVTWVSPTQITSDNDSSTAITDPTIVVKNDGQPIIFYRALSSGSYRSIHYRHFNGSSWSSGHILYNGTPYDQSNPCAVVDSNGAIHVVWQGKDSTDNLYDNLRYSKSTDGGASWSSMLKLTSQNTNNQNSPTIVADKDNKLYIFWSGISNGYQTIRRLIFDGAWSSIVDMTSVETAINPSAMSSNSMVGWIYQRYNSSVQFDKITLNTPPTAPTGLTRSNFDATQSAAFSWQHNDPDAGDTQSGYNIEYSENVAGATVIYTGLVASTVSSRTFAANTFTNGKEYKWRVRTYDSQNETSPWSDWAVFRCGSAPSATVTDPTANTMLNGSLYTFRGSYSQAQGRPQKSFRFILWDAAGTTIVQDSGTITGTSNAKTFENLANNTSYQIQMEATSQDDIVGQSAKVAFSIAYTPPQIPSISVEQDSLNATVTVNITNPTPGAGQPSVLTNEIYRRKYGESSWTKVGEATSIFVDHQCPAGLHEYMALAVGNNGTKSDRSAIEVLNATFSGWWIVDRETSEKFQFVYNVPSAQITLDEERQEIRTFSSKPFVRYGTFKAERGTLAGLKLIEGSSARDQVLTLQSLLSRRKPFLLKNNRGDVWIVNLYNLRRSYGIGMTAEPSVEWVEVL